jgi:hypothetical protein
MGSTGDRAASLMLGEREACTWGRTASSASCGQPRSTNPKTNEALDGTGSDTVLPAAVRAFIHINLPIDIWNTAYGGVRTKSLFWGEL